MLCLSCCRFSSLFVALWEINRLRSCRPGSSWNRLARGSRSLSSCARRASLSCPGNPCSARSAKKNMPTYPCSMAGGSLNAGPILARLLPLGKKMRGMKSASSCITTVSIGRMLFSLSSLKPVCLSLLGSLHLPPVDVPPTMLRTVLRVLRTVLRTA